MIKFRVRYRLGRLGVGRGPAGMTGVMPGLVGRGCASGEGGDGDARNEISDDHG
jgi:hypothetical protein